MTKLEAALAEEIEKLRKRFADVEIINRLNVTITIAGPVNVGEVLVTYVVSEYDYDSDAVKGNSLEACTFEYMRRKGWTKTNLPLALTFEKPVGVQQIGHEEDAPQHEHLVEDTTPDEGIAF